MAQKQKNCIVKRGGTYSVRVMIPKDIRHLYGGKREKLKALGTSSPVKARELGAEAVSSILWEFNFARQYKELPSDSRSEQGGSPSRNLKSLPNTVGSPFKPSVYSEILFETPSGAANSVPTVLEAFDMYEAENPRGVSADTFRQSRLIVRLFSEFLGKNPPVTLITKANVRQWKIALSEWPVRANEVSELKGLSFPEAILVCRDLWGARVRPCISRKTINKYLSALGGFCSWLTAATDYLTSNPVDGMYHKLDKSERKVLPFSNEQLSSFFRSPIYSGCKSDEEDFLPGDLLVRDYRYWLPLIALYSGARLGEIAQLETADVKQLHGTWVFHITREGSTKKTTKTPGSQRVVPIHPKLIEFGLTELHASRLNAGCERLFPEIECDTRGQISGRPSRWFGRYMARVGLREGNKFNFHSFRHTATDALRRAGYTDDQIAPLLGHAKVTMTARYGIEPVGTVRQRRDMIAAIDYDLDLSHLIPQARVEAA